MPASGRSRPVCGRPSEGAVVFAEVYPSLWAVSPAAGEPKDAAQVRSVARFFAERDRAGELAALFAGDPVLTPEQRNRVETEEAWTLGVTAARQRPIPVPSIAPTLSPHPASRALAAGGCRGSLSRYAYLRDPAEITRRSFALIRAEADLARFPRPLRPLAMRLAHAAGDSTILGDLAWSRGRRRGGAQGARGRRADPRRQRDGRGRDHDASGCRPERDHLHAARPRNRTALAAAQRTTRSAAAVELWRPHLAGAVVAIGNAPTALFRLLEILAAGAPKPALVLGFPVGFVGAAEAKAALADFRARARLHYPPRPARRQRACRRRGQCAREHRVKPWLAVIGIGEDGIAGLARRRAP